MTHPRYAVSKTAAYASSFAASIMVASSFQLAGSDRVEYWGDQRLGARARILQGYYGFSLSRYSLNIITLSRHTSLSTRFWLSNTK